MAKRKTWVPPGEDEVRRAAGALVELVEESLPQRFWGGEHEWKVMAAAVIVRLADTLESIVAVMDAGHELDGLILLRAFYEQVVVFCWASIDRETNPERWRLNAIYWLRKLHEDMIPYSQKVLTRAELEEAEKGVRMPPLIQLAGEVDEHWGGRLVGFRAPSSNDILNFSGLYLPIYRMGSRAAHGEATALNIYIDHGYPRRVDRATRDERSAWWSLAIPLYAQALLVCNEQLNWPDPERVRAINNAMYARK